MIKTNLKKWFVFLAMLTLKIYAIGDVLKDGLLYKLFAPFVEEAI